MPLRSIVPSIQLPLDERARAAFFSHYVRGFSTTYDMLERIDYEPALAASVDAVSLAFFSFQYDAATALKPAREKYLSALSLVKNALDAPRFLVSNSTMLAVLFLDLFEKIVNRDPIPSESWMSHIRGALALVKLRDPGQLTTYVGLRLSKRLFTNVLISCIAANSSLPPELKALHSDLQPYVPKDDPKWQLSGLVMKLADFRGSFVDGLLSISEALARAKSLDKEFSSLARNLQPSWISRRIPAQKDSSHVLEHNYDGYPDSYMAQACNVIRIIRILLNDFIRLMYMSSVSATPDTNVQVMNIGFASHVIDSMAKEICATGPQLTVGADVSTRPTTSSSTRRLHCYTLLFPLYVAATHATPESGIRDWVLQLLRFIATNCAIRNAGLVADMLARAETPGPWAVYTMLGSYAFAA